MTEQLGHFIGGKRVAGKSGRCGDVFNPAAGEVTAKVAGGTTVKIEEATDYPFSQTISFKVSVDAKDPTAFPLYLRIPRWCDGAKVAVNGEDRKTDSKPLTYVVVDRPWKTGDTVTLTLPMKVGVRTWAKNKGSVSVDYGPLTFALEIGERWSKYGGSDEWPEFEVFPTTPWNYGLVLDGASPTKSFEVVKKPGPVAAQPFTHEAAPVKIKAKAKKIPNWTTDKRGLLRVLEQSPVKSAEPTETVTLIPMGAARLRISAFPVIGEGADAKEWPTPTAGAKGPAGTATASASHSWGADTVDALNDGEMPRTSNDQSIPRHTFWDHKGTAEWLEYDWTEPRTLSGASVYWFDDTGKGECRVPASWRLTYKDGDAWKPVELQASAYETKTDTFNRATFKPVKTAALRVEVQLQPNVSGGVLEWRVE